jgi:hypothetical protein
MGKMPSLNDDKQIKEMPFKVNTVTKVADYTVKASESGTFFDNRGATAAVNFTLPAFASGLNYLFYAAADFAVTVTSGTADLMIADDDVAADSLALSTGSEIMGGAIQVVSDGTKWMAMTYLEESQTAVVAS